MTKNKKKSFKVTQNRYNTPPENESYDQLMKSKTTAVNLTDFPALKTSFSKNDNVIYSPSCKSESPKKKSFLSIVNKSSVKNLVSEEAFPALHNSEYKKKNENNLKTEKDEKPIAGSENIEKAVTQKFHIPREGEGSTPCPKNINLQPQRNPLKKKRSDPVVLNFQDIISVRKPFTKTKKSGVLKSKSQRHGNKEILSGNILDSSNPKRSRGKHREVQKKKFTKLKIAIIKERIIKQKIKEEAINESECFRLIESIDFKTEIKNYTEELNKRKNKNLECVSNIKRISNDEATPEAVKENIATKQENVVKELKEKKVEQFLPGSKIKFTSKFREYCDNVVTPDLNSSVSELIRELVKLQDRVHARDPIKAKAKRRHVSGMREVNKYLTLKKVKLFVIAPNLEKMQMGGGLYGLINDMKSTADAQGVPYAFALDRYALGRCTKKNVPVSAFAVLSYEGLEELFERTLHHLKEAKESFLELTKIKGEKEEDEKEEKKKEDVNVRVMSSLISIFKEELHLNESKENFQSEPELLID